MGRNHTLFSLVDGLVKFTREARKQLPPRKGEKWVKKPWRKFVNVMRTPELQPVTLQEFR